MTVSSRGSYPNQENIYILSTYPMHCLGVQKGCIVGLYQFSRANERVYLYEIRREDWEREAL